MSGWEEHDTNDERLTQKKGSSFANFVVCDGIMSFWNRGKDRKRHNSPQAITGLGEKAEERA